MGDIAKIKDCMDTDAHAVGAGDDVHTVVKMLIDKRITGAPVVDGNGKVVGMVTERECLTLLTHPSQKLATVDQLMSTDFVIVQPDMDVTYVAGLFNKHSDQRRFPVVEGESLVGVVTRKDVLRAIRHMGD